MKPEEERKRVVGWLHSHAPRRTSILACTLATTYTCIHSRTWAQAHMQTCAVRATGCVVNSCPQGFMLCAPGGSACCWGGFRAHQRTRHLTQTGGSWKLPLEASQANCIHPHTTGCLQADVLPFELTAIGPFLRCYAPRPGRSGGCKSVCADLLQWPPKNRAKAALKAQLPA